MQKRTVLPNATPPLSENIENLDKVVLSASWLTADADGAFVDFLMFSNSHPPTPPAGLAHAPEFFLTFMFEALLHWKGLTTEILWKINPPPLDLQKGIIRIIIIISIIFFLLLFLLLICVYLLKKKNGVNFVRRQVRPFRRISPHSFT